MDALDYERSVPRRCLSVRAAALIGLLPVVPPVLTYALVFAVTGGARLGYGATPPNGGLLNRAGSGCFVATLVLMGVVLLALIFLRDDRRPPDSRPLYAFLCGYGASLVLIYVLATTDPMGFLDWLAD